MGINPSNSHYGSFTFNGVTASTYGVYITDVNVFDAPKRSIEYYAIPGKNGDFALDQGRFENVEIVYSCAMEQETDSDFLDAINTFKNLLASAKGYCRLEDDMNPDEYRMGVFSEGLEIDTKNTKAATFEVKFNCKPQRWLTSGETAVAIANNGTIDNPTLYDAEPLLAVKGYGNLTFNGFSIDVEDIPLGNMYITDSDVFSESHTYTFDDDLFNAGDNIAISGNYSFTASVIQRNNNAIAVTTQSASDTNSNFSTDQPNFIVDSTNKAASAQIKTQFSGSFAVGTDSTITNAAVISLHGLAVVDGAFTCTWSATQTITYDANNATITVSLLVIASKDTAKVTVSSDNRGGKITIIGDSTVSALGNPTYIDCEIGEAYMYKNGKVVSCNSAVALGSELPKLAHGTNTFVYDNTITELKVTPRFWKV